MSTSKEKKMVKLRSSDNQEFQIEESAAIQSNTIKNMLEDCSSEVVPLPNVQSTTLALVIEYLNKHVDTSLNEDAIKDFDKESVKRDNQTLFEVILASNYLDIQGLLDISCQKIADEIKDYSVEQVRNLFGIKNDFTEEEEKAIRQEHAWAFE